MDKGTETITEHIVEAMENGRWSVVGTFNAAQTMEGYTGCRSVVPLPLRYFEVTTTRTVRAVQHANA